jgi:hypothetical protein
VFEPSMRITAYLLLISSAALILTLAAACDPEAGTLCERHVEVHPLVLAHDWTATAAENDPLAEHRPESTICPRSAWGEELGVLEVSTGACNYLSIEQPLSEAIALGDPLRVQVWWQALISSEPASGHLALLIDGERIWELEVEIPSPADARSIIFESPIAAEAGATVTFHLHNHGANSWTLAELARLDRDAACE